MIDKIKHIIKTNPWLGFFLFIQVVILVWGGVVFDLFSPIEPAFDPDLINEYQLQIVPGWEGSRFLQWLLGSWFRWDNTWFMRIAIEGYQPVDGRLTFAPVYPFLVGSLGRMIGGQYLLAGLLVSSISLLGACFLLYEEFQRLTDNDTAERGLRYLLHFPTAFFLFGGYTESLFLLLLLLTWRAARKEAWIQAGVWGALLVLTRFLGGVIGLPLAYLWWRTQRKNKIKAALSLSLIPLAFVGWNLLAKWQYGRFVWEEIDNVWKLHTYWSFAGMWNNLKEILAHKMLSAHLYADLFLAVLFITLTVIAFRKLPVEYGLLMVGLLAISVLKVTNYGLLESVSRYVLPIFPGFLVLADWGKNRWFHRVWTVLTLALLLLLASIFFTWGWVA
ncbi:MAG: hypothetical protein E3J88_01925 [Anaerolineales bacterium]|nr:MAG: hypothetical protein E3J88_01925 [Anaerolineales bacterium]